MLDTDRVMHLRNCLSQLRRAIIDWAPVKGCFLVGLLDNFEWSVGHPTCFGIHDVECETQKRTPKLSTRFHKEVIPNDRVA